MRCEKCSTDMIAVEKKKSVSATGLLGVVLFLIGAGVAFANIIFGVIIIIVGLLISIMGRGKQITMTCPSCGHKGKPISV